MSNRKKRKDFLTDLAYLLEHHKVTLTIQYGEGSTEGRMVAEIDGYSEDIDIELGDWFNSEELSLLIAKDELTIKE